MCKFLAPSTGLYRLQVRRNYFNKTEMKISSNKGNEKHRCTPKFQGTDILIQTKHPIQAQRTNNDMLKKAISEMKNGLGKDKYQQECKAYLFLSRAGDTLNLTTALGTRKKRLCKYKEQSNGTGRQKSTNEGTQQQKAKCMEIKCQKR